MRRRVREIVFHLGDPKTGSTAIQETLAAGAFRSTGAQICYPTKLNHIPLATSLFEAEERGAAERRFSKLAGDIAAADADIAVVSAELFEMVNPEVLRGMVETHLPELADKARYIAYVRPHANRILAAYAERTKNGLIAAPIERFHETALKNGIFQYTPRFLKWRETFGDRFELRPFIRNRLADGDVVKDFLGFVLGPDPFELTQSSRSNESLSVEDLAVIREFHLRTRGMPELDKIRGGIGWNLARAFSGHPGDSGTKPALHRSLATRIVSAYRADAVALDAAFFDGTPMSDALEEAPRQAIEKRQSYQAKDHFSDSELRRLHCWIDFAADLIQVAPDKVRPYFRKKQFEALTSQQRDQD